jgi:hypothetical protein
MHGTKNVDVCVHSNICTYKPFSTTAGCLGVIAYQRATFAVIRNPFPTTDCYGSGSYRVTNTVLHSVPRRHTNGEPTRVPPWQGNEDRLFTQPSRKEDGGRLKAFLEGSPRLGERELSVPSQTA